MKYTLIIFALLFASHLSFAQTEPLEGKEKTVELNQEIEGKKSVKLIDSASLPTSNEPLLIMEGIIVDKNNLDEVDPSTIKGVEVLKGDKATSLYGAKGSNGVIIITLKKKYAKKFKKKQEKKK
ncbi:MAG: Ca-activated chloride channel family protein [Maribacter sp.]|jgi:Ca-activated chloride channel family protein